MAEKGADRYGVMGYPISQSRSPMIHQIFARQTGQEMEYERIEVRPGELAAAVNRFQQTGGKGLNITVPHKIDVLEIPDAISDRAKIAGSVNTLVFQNERIFGDNTDGVGIVRDLENNLGLTLSDSNILILGAGGATRGIVEPLLNTRPAGITIANRTFSKANELVDRFTDYGPVTACRFDDLSLLSPCDLIINATSAGAHPCTS